MFQALFRILAILILTVGCMQTVCAAEPRQWPVELNIGRFEIHCDFRLESKFGLEEQLSGMSQDLADLVGGLPEKETVHIVLFRTPAEYTRYMKTYFPQLPARRALYIQDRGPGMLFAHWHDEIATDLRHELTHALLNAGSHHLPLWLDEGLAEYYEVESANRFAGCDYLTQVIDRSASGFVPSLKQLEVVQTQNAFGESQYRDSWSWVHFLLHRNQQTRQLLVEYIRGARSGAEQMPLSRQLIEIMPDVSAEYRRHFESVAAAMER